MLVIPFSFFKAGAASTVLTHTFNSGSGTETVPSGKTALTVKLWGKGGNGSWRVGVSNGGGGGGGGYAVKTFAVVAGDIGKSIAWDLSTSAVTIVGDATATNLTNAALNLAVTTAANATTTTGGAGGVASGGSTNITGATGSAGGTSGTGGAAAGPGGGAGGAEAQNGFAPGGGGGGANTDADNAAGTGAAPRAIFEWS